MVRRNGKKEAIGNCSELMMHCEDSEKLNGKNTSRERTREKLWIRREFNINIFKLEIFIEYL